MELTTKEAADRLNSAGLKFAPEDVAILAQAKAFRHATKIAGIWHIPSEDVDQFISRKKKAFWIRTGSIVGILAFISCVFGAISATKDGRDLVREIFSKPTSTAQPLTPDISQVVVGADNTSYKFEITVDNPSGKDILVKNVSMASDQYADTHGGQCLPPTTYTLSETIKIVEVIGNKLIFKSDIISGDPELAGYSFDGSGEYIYGCQTHLKIRFDTSLVLSKNSYTSFYLVIPKTIKVIPVSGPGTAMNEIKNLDISIGSCSKESFLDCLLSFILTTDDGQKLDYGGSLIYP